MKRFFKRIFSLIFIITLGFLCYYYQDWFKEQYRHAKGVYYIFKGDQAYSADNMGKTLEFYQKGLELFPGHYEAWFNLGNIYAVYEDYYSAVDAYEHAIKAHPKFVMARMNLGIVYSDHLGFFDEAIEQYDEITKIDLFKLWIPYVYSNVKSIKGNRALAYYNKGIAFRRKALYLPIEKQHLVYEYLGHAKEAYDKAIEIIDNNQDFYYNRGVIHHLRGEYKDAGLDYCKAIELEPMNFEGHYNLAVLLRRINKNREAISELEKAAILISENSNSTELQTAYIFNLLNEVSRRFITSNEFYTEKLTDEPSGSISYTYVNGRIVADEEFDKAMYNNFKTCAGYSYFSEERY
ncbi:MAG: tetratricopeptide repeat protein [Cyanobacteria bacterium SIG28]|nr:tetratricopeptide repeat protein [Cyanobacteria bacterium SIG28]